MATEVELERLVVRMMGDGSSYQKMLREANAQTKVVERDINASVGRMSGSMTALLGPLAGAAAGYLSLQAAISTTSKAISAASAMEQNEIAFGTLLRSADTAKVVLKDLSKFAADTPFDMPELTSATRQLAAFGFEAGQLVPELRMLGDVSAGLSQPIGDIAYLYGTARVQGRLFQQDINQFTNRGVPIIKALSNTMGVAETEIRKLTEAGKIGFPELQRAFQSLTKEGGQFHNMMDQQSKSLAGVWGTLTDNLTMLTANTARTLLDAFDMTGVISGLNQFVETFQSGFQSLVDSPSLKALIGILKGMTIMLVDGFAQSWRILKDTAEWAIGAMGGDMLKFLATTEFVFRNWHNIGALAINTVLYEAVKFFNETTHFFTETLPALLSWFQSNWQNVFFTAVDYATTILIKRGKASLEGRGLIASSKSEDSPTLTYTITAAGSKALAAQ